MQEVWSWCLPPMLGVAQADLPFPTGPGISSSAHCEDLVGSWRRNPRGDKNDLGPRTVGRWRRLGHSKPEGRLPTLRGTQRVFKDVDTEGLEVSGQMASCERLDVVAALGWRLGSLILSVVILGVLGPLRGEA